MQLLSSFLTVNLAILTVVKQFLAFLCTAKSHVYLQLMK